MNSVYMVSVMSGMLYYVVSTTAEYDSLVLYAAHLHRVPKAFSVLGGGHCLRQIALVSLTTGENNQILFTTIIHSTCTV